MSAVTANDLAEKEVEPQGGNEYAIEVANLNKFYGPYHALRDISFNVRKGEILGFLGPNGAGKTTTMRILSGYMPPTSGSARIAGFDVFADSMQARRRIGYLPETVPLYTDMSVWDYLEFAAKLHHVREVEDAVERAMELVNLQDRADTQIGRLSKGYRQRVGIAQAIVHDPPVLILDEPTVGIDPIQVAQTRKLIRELGGNRTILLSTHILPEASMICERVVIIHEGRIAAQDRIENLSALLKGGKRMRLQVRGPAAEVTTRLRGISSLGDVRYEEPWHIVKYSSGQEPQAEITELLVRAGWTLLAMESVEMSLEDIFLQLTTEEANR